MFDGSDVARTVRYVSRRSGPQVKVIYTGHPPVEQQLADQVRSGSGMTFGVRTADGARMPPAFMSPRMAAEPTKRKRRVGHGRAV